MTKVRMFVGVAVTALMVLGYVASVQAALSRDFVDYYTRVDQPAIVNLALIAFLGLLLLYFVPIRDGEES